MELNRLENQRSNKVTGTIFILLVLLSIMSIGIMLQQFYSKGTIVGDQLILELFGNGTNAFVVGLFTLLTELGSKWGIGGLFIVSLIFIWWKYKDYLAMILVTVCVLGSNELNKWLKEEVGRERPLIDESIYAEGFSFPSGHAMVGITFYGFITFYFISKMVNKKIKYTLAVGMAIFIFLIGFSRIILNAHYPSDVFGGFAIGFLYLSICILIYNIVRKRKTTGS